MKDWALLWGRIERVTRQAGLGDCGAMLWLVFTAMLDDIGVDGPVAPVIADAGRVQDEIAAAKQAAAVYQPTTL